MSTSMSISPAGMQASAAVFNVDSVAKSRVEKRDDVVAPIETTNNQATKADISLLKMSDSSMGQNLDIQV
jgi:hypothetical protein